MLSKLEWLSSYAETNFSNVCKEIGIPAMTYQEWRDDKKIGDEDFRKIAEFFKIDEYDLLMPHEDAILCSNRSDMLKNYILHLKNKHRTVCEVYDRIVERTKNRTIIFAVLSFFAGVSATLAVLMLLLK